MDEYRKHERREKMTQYAFPTKKNTFKANGLSINFACEYQWKILHAETTSCGWAVGSAKARSKN